MDEGERGTDRGDRDRVTWLIRPAAARERTRGPLTAPSRIGAVTPCWRAALTKLLAWAWGVYRMMAPGGP
jgi:hypothetical protein